MHYEGVCAAWTCRQWRALMRPILDRGISFWHVNRRAIFAEHAAGEGRLALLKWARARGCPWDASVCAAAARHGHLGVLQWLRAKGCPWNDLTCANAARGGHLAVLQWARANKCPWDNWTCGFTAASAATLDILQWARANGCPCVDDCDVCVLCLSGARCAPGADIFYP
ncbi:ankyrin repeat protein [Pandoravirus inopinatum]|uniref:Ankyrin repeat protein n=1 Tax=Pandoravirus inopinatum TaxID=1605721 RepID=A0A0B5J1A4_9VIRU|nr:ankyrin repeat protein [Pandoravirus inopinatum]AJF97249.1 ankyrin repeat protein [Pandoravirus inopinatum]